MVTHVTSGHTRYSGGHSCYSAYGGWYQYHFEFNK